MEALETIQEVFARNIRDLRGNRTQADVAEALGMPLRTYQHLESGKIPRTREYLTALADFYGIRETRLFLDPDLIPPPAAPVTTPQEALEVLRQAIGAPVAINNGKSHPLALPAGTPAYLVKLLTLAAQVPEAELDHVIGGLEIRVSEIESESKFSKNS